LRLRRELLNLVAFATVATAMNLAPCALGCGDSDLFARAAETDYLVESSVGEFLLGIIGVLT